LRGGRIEYGLANFSAIFAQKRNLANPNFLRMLRDILKFNARGLELAQDPTMTISEFLQRLGSGPWFRDYYLLPLSGAIWSTPTEKILDFPARAMLQFFENHALLSHTGQHQWYTVQGGSQEYVQRLEAALVDRGVAVRVKTPVSSVIRHDRQVEIRSAGHPPEYFDEVVFATHSDDSLRLLEDPSAFEAQALGAVKYQPNNITLHCDERIMPKRRACWSSWVYTETEDKTSDQIDLTYWMNSLQPIPLDDPHFVTLNSTRPIREDKIYDQVTLRHPVYDLHALAAQEKIATRNGTNRTWFCGAWMKNGFHEDGLSSGLDVAQSIILKSALAVAAE
jgi:predicted NAD/FAD-binding protein